MLIARSNCADWMEPEDMTQAVIDFLATRRSVKPDRLALPAPSEAELAAILKIAARVPDHKKLAPWRFIIFDETARVKFGEIIANVCAEDEQPAPSAQRLETERHRFLRAPLVIAVISCALEQRAVPIWEQTLSAGAVAFNLCLAANAHGYSTSWLTEWMAYNSKINQALGLADNEKVVGFVHMGTASETPQERDRPVMDEIVSHWTPRMSSL